MRNTGPANRLAPRSLFAAGIRNRYLFAADALSLTLSALISFAVQFESKQWLVNNRSLIGVFIAIAVPLQLLVMYRAGMYRRLWRQASIVDLRHILAVAVIMTMLVMIVFLWLIPRLTFVQGSVPFAVLFLNATLSCGGIGLPRLLARTMRGQSAPRLARNSGKPALIIGAGDTAKLIVKELIVSPALGLQPIGFVDDDSGLHGHMLRNLPIFGPLSLIKELVERHGVTQLIIAMPSATGDVMRSVVRIGLDCGIPTLTVPSLAELIAGKGSGTTLREVQIEDLLRREAVQTDLASVAACVTSETVLVTGAGGSIGSELCRQLARLAPKAMVLLGHGENSIFDIQNELRTSYPDVKFIPVIADVRDRARIFDVLGRLRPRSIFHAAAHKHVPLMEENLIEAITNNVVGTRNLTDAAIEARVEHFVLISTDKAVRPTSVMGATKRVAELVVQNAAMKHDRKYVSVRFGNVLGSRGSVVPTFLRQIRSGGPVTVTHPEMQRYFMTIPEAVQLVLQAGALGLGGEVFLLDMGAPVRIVELAADLIRLSGLSVGEDIELKFTGIRSGEKLYEEMFFSAERVIETDHPKILRARNSLLPDSVMRRIDGLVAATNRPSSDEEFRELLRQLVPDFHTHAPTADGEEASASSDRTSGERSSGMSS